MFTAKLTNNEIQRIKRAADHAGFPWQPICERPKVARRFMRRVEAEMRRSGASTDSRGLREFRLATA